jgi:hypothetical protein
MRHLMTVDSAARRGRGPEEIALDAWLEDAGPYLSLVEVFGSVEASLRTPEPRGRATHRSAHVHAASPLRVTFD